MGSFCLTFVFSSSEYIARNGYLSFKLNFIYTLEVLVLSYGGKAIHEHRRKDFKWKHKEDNAQKSRTKKNLFYQLEISALGCSRKRRYCLFIQEVMGVSRDLCFLWSADGGIPVPEALDKRYHLYSRELGTGKLNRLLVLHSAMSSSLRVSVPWGSGQGHRCPLLPSSGPPALGIGLEIERRNRNPTNQASWTGPSCRAGV